MNHIISETNWDNKIVKDGITKQHVHENDKI